MFLTISCSFNSDVNYNEHKKHTNTFAIKKSNLFIEDFIFFGSGATGTDITQSFATDSINFRIYIGKVNTNKYFYYYSVDNNKLKVSKKQNVNDTFILTGVKYLSIDSLKISKTMVDINDDSKLFELFH